MTARRCLSALGILSTILVAPEALAAPRTHDGLYLRMALGFGGVSMTRDVDAEVAGARFAAGESTVAGGALHTELSLGGSPARGFVIGGSLLTHTMAEAEIEADGGATRDLASPLRFLVIGPSIDWFPSSTGGFHVGAVLGLAAAWAELPDDELFRGIGGAGGALSLGLGYDWWLANEWSLGVIGRFTGANVRGEDTESGVTAEEQSQVGAFTVAFTALYH